MIGKRGKFWGGSGNSRRWSWSDVRRQTVPPATRNARSPRVDSRVRRITSCEDVTETEAVLIDAECSRKIPWRRTIQASANEPSQLEIDAFRQGRNHGWKVEGTKVWVPPPGRLRPAFGQRPGWVFGARGGRSFPLWGCGVSLPENFWKLRC